MDDKKKQQIDQAPLRPDERDFEGKAKETTDDVEPADASSVAEAVDDKKTMAGKQELDQLKSLVGQLDNNYKRALADYQNLQRRTQEEKTEWIMTANKQLVLKLLPILDTLMLAEEHTKDKSFTLTVQQFLQLLKEEGIERIKTIGESFDPLVMEAVETREGEDLKVLEELKAGFRSGEIIIRPAFVVVGKSKPKLTMNEPPTSQEEN